MIHAKARLRKFKSQIPVHTRAAQPQASFQAEVTPRSIMGPGGRFSKGPLTGRVRKAILETMMHWQ